ncbi:MAG: hypothetical protein JKY50_04890 [Oleispira sp.]|nr:hypothetical protein [Oleispira sp.]MBL4880805.1 hypothetical protein [Oleispira sp.]
MKKINLAILISCFHRRKNLSVLELINKKQTMLFEDVEFVERQVWCGAQMNYGMEITLKEGEEDYLLDQFTQ